VYHCHFSTRSSSPPSSLFTNILMLLFNYFLLTLHGHFCVRPASILVCRECTCCIPFLSALPILIMFSCLFHHARCYLMLDRSDGYHSFRYLYRCWSNIASFPIYMRTMFEAQNSSALNSQIVSHSTTTSIRTSTDTTLRLVRPCHTGCDQLVLYIDDHVIYH
jgi:hypothetical protein